MNDRHTMPDTAECSDAELVARSLEGDREAFSRIVARYQSLVCSLTYSAMGNLGASEDLAQETFLTAWRTLARLREPGKLRFWLCGIARGLTTNAVRRRAHEPVHAAESLDGAHASPATGPLPSEYAINREEEAILWRSLERIPEHYREPLILYYREHQSIERVAGSLELSEDAVKQRLARGRKLLQEQVLAFVEGALAATNPGKTFTLGVLAALPAVAVSAGAATMGAAAANTGLGAPSAITLTQLLLMTKSTKLAIVAALGIAAVVTPVAVHQNVSGDRPHYWEADAAALKTMPAVLILRPTRFARHGGTTRDGNKILSKDIRLNELLSYAYGVTQPRMLLPTGLSDEHFDLLLTLPTRPLETLRETLRKKFGLTAHRETRETDVLILKVKTPDAPGLRISQDRVSSVSGHPHELTARNIPISDLAGSLDWRLAKPVIDQTGLDARYDIHLQWEPRPDETDNAAYQRALLEQLGLELLPGREPVEMWVVDQAG